MRSATLTRFALFLLAAAFILLVFSAPVFAQDDPNDTPLGDLARSLRKKPSPPDAFIDNDNLSKAMQDAATRHAASPVFSLDPQGNHPAGKNFHVSSPDVTCSLSFSAKSTELTDPLLLDELPRAELSKLNGPATIDGDTLQVSMHNGTGWEIHEVVIGLTIVNPSAPVEASSSITQARIVPAAAGFPANATASPNVPDSYQKQPDVTLLLHVKGSAGPSTTATFRTPLNFSLFPDQDWHWAIVRAKGVPPQAPPELTTVMQNAITTQTLGAPFDAATKTPPPRSPSDKLPLSPEPEAH